MVVGTQHYSYQHPNIAHMSLFDTLTALWCCLSQSWVNPVERVISLINLALQNCALERDLVETAKFENMLKKVTTMNQLRTLSKRTKNLKKEFSKSMKSVKSLVNNRFELVALKKKSIATKKTSNRRWNTRAWERDQGNG